jgi:hypothetical protein
LSGAAAADYLARPEPLAWALAALMRWPTADRYAQRRACLERIAGARFLSGAHSFLLFNCVATYLVLDGKAREVFQGLLAQHGNEEGQVAMMTWAEMESAKIEAEIEAKIEAKVEAKVRDRVLLEGRQQGRQEGRLEGRQEGMREVVLHLLSRRFATLPAGVAKRISAIDSAEELAGLAERVLSANSLEELGLA